MMKTISIAIVLSLVALIWSWNYRSQANTILRRSQTQFDSCVRLATEISQKRSRSVVVGVAPPNYDYARNLTRLLAGCQIAAERGISLAGSRVVITDGGISKKAISNPIVQTVSLDQIISLLSATEAGDIRYYVETIELTAPAKKLTAGQSEQWMVSDIDMCFFEADDDIR
jgi:hypothetical protein